MNDTRHYALSAMTACLLAMQPLSIQAGERGQIAAEAQINDLDIEELGNVIVTARRREENLQDVPVAVSVLSRDQLKRHDIRDIVDLSGAVPNLVIAPMPQTGAGALVWLRGFGTLNPEKTNDPPVNIYVDGVYLGTNTGQLLQVFDFERMEVLRGVQGTLFGKNATGGAINITRSRPSGDAVTGQAAITVGSYGRNDYQAVLNAPLVQGKFWVKVAGLSRNDDGYMKNITNAKYRGGKNYKSGSFVAVAKPTDTLTLDIAYDRIDDDSQSVPFIQGFVPTALQLPVSTPTGPLSIGPYTPCVRFSLCAMPTNVNVANANGPALQSYSLNGVTSTITYQMDQLDLISITGWRESDDQVIVDVDATPQTFFNTNRKADYEQVTQEFRAVSRNTGPFNYVAGAYYFTSQFHNAQDVAQDTAYFSGTAAPGTLIYLGFRPEQFARSWALYVQGDYQILPELKVTLGGRYTRDTKAFEHQLFNYTDQYFGGETPRSARFLGHYRSDAFTPHVSASYKILPSLMTYVSYSRGYNGGGFNPGGTNAFNIGPYSSEHIDDYEVGMKADFLDQKLRLNANGFHIRYAGKQLSVITTDPLVGASSQIKNVGNLEINGLEADVTAVPLRGLNLIGSLGYMDARYTKFMAQILASQPVTDNTALTPVRTPKFTISGEASYTFPVGPGDMTFTGLYRYQSRYQLDAINSPQGWVKPGSVLDASASFDVLYGEIAWQLSVAVKNITDRIHPIQLTQAGTFLNEKVLREGRTFSATLQAKF
jgi:iron complex outermembrane receptor protein